MSKGRLLSRFFFFGLDQGRLKKLVVPGPGRSIFCRVHYMFCISYRHRALLSQIDPAIVFVTHSRAVPWAMEVDPDWKF